MVKKTLVIVIAMGFAASFALADKGVITLPKTGATTSFAPGDDGDLEKGMAWPDPRFVVSGDVVTDKLTGLMWEKSPPPKRKTWAEALTYANDLTLGGYSDWRLPNINELESLMSWEMCRFNDIILDDDGFVNVQYFAYWSSTTSVAKTTVAFFMAMNPFDGFFVSTHPKDERWLAWAVRAESKIIPKTGQTESYASGDDGELQKGVSWPEPRFTVSGDVVIDNLTGLMWEKAPLKTLRNWDDAVSYVKSLSLGGFRDWRVPNLKELRSLANFGQTDSAAWLNDQGFKKFQPGGYRSSTFSNPWEGFKVVSSGAISELARETSYAVLAVRSAE